MKVVYDLFDSYDYATTNCFVHQLTRRMIPTDVTSVPLGAIKDWKRPRPDAVVCRLKQRTLARELGAVRAWCGDAPVVVYDQDPWYACADTSPGRGTYVHVAANLNVVAFALTTLAWVDFVNDHCELPARFVAMGVLPEYCDSAPSYVDRTVPLGFVGSVHSRRKRLFDDLDDMGLSVNVQAGNDLRYVDYLRALSNVRTFVHSEAQRVVADGQELDYADALWIKDVEAIARGCFTVRNAGKGSEPYYDGLKAALVYDDVRQVPEMLARIERMDPLERQRLLDDDVETIRRRDAWTKTADDMVRWASDGR